MQFIDSKTIRLDRILSELDKFVLMFIKILRKHTDYVIVSGYVAILFGRTRTTEDVDVIIPKISKESFSELFSELSASGYWSLNSSYEAELFGMLDSNVSVRFAIDKEISPNIEIKFSRNNSDLIALKDKLRVQLAKESLFIAPLELQIAYKEKVLASDKDLEDSAHLRVVFSQYLNKPLLDKYLGELEA